LPQAARASVATQPATTRAIGFKVQFIIISKTVFVGIKARQQGRPKTI